MVLVFSAVLTAGITFTQAASERRLPISRLPGAEFLLDFVWQAVFATMSLIVTIGLFILIYKVMPNTRVYWIEALPSAVVCGAAWERSVRFASRSPGASRIPDLYGGIWLALGLPLVYIIEQVLLFARSSRQLHGGTSSNGEGEFPPAFGIIRASLPYTTVHWYSGAMTEARIVL